jgi:hypothetical protein
VVPDPIYDEVKSAFLSFNLDQQKPEKGPLYSIQLRLKPESIASGELWFKGEAVPAMGSQFKKSDGAVVSQFYPYGYAEMTLIP